MTHALPFYEEGLPAGFPSPADDYLEKSLDLHELIVKHPAATFFIRVQGESMQGAGIFSEDILVVDRSLSPLHNQIVVALLNGEFTVKRLQIKQNSCTLVAEHPGYAPIDISSDDDFHVWGVVTYVIHRAR